MKKIVVRISPSGETVVETSGFAGDSCLREAGNLERALGTARKTVRTAEYYRQAEARKERGFKCES